MTLFNDVHGQKPREIAARVLAWRRSPGRHRLGNGGGHEFTEALLERALAKADLAAADRGLCQELVFGVVRWQATLDWLIALKTQGREQKPGLQDLLRLGLYQIFWLDRIPDHAAVHETVAMAKREGYGPQSGFVNAVLRGFLREAAATKCRLAELKTTQPALGWSQPEWLVTRWRRRWGADQLRSLLEWNNAPAKLFARVNTLRTDAGKLVAQWRDENVGFEVWNAPGAAKTARTTLATPPLPGCDWTGENLVFELKSHPPLAKLESFRQGGFYIQDPSTLLAVRELDPRAGETILDLCAAPGGKTTFIAQLMNNKGRIVACDIAQERLKLLTENCTRLGATCVEILKGWPGVDEAVASPASTVERQNALPVTLGPRRTPMDALLFDRVLVDAPCSNSGVLRRRVDLRWRLRPEEITRLRTIQLGLLHRAAPLLKPGGVLVYSTCSLEPEENDEVVSRFLNESSGFKLERQREVVPFAHGVDGAFVARLSKSL